jgi:hypothetical protein
MKIAGNSELTGKKAVKWVGGRCATCSVFAWHEFSCGNPTSQYYRVVAYHCMKFSKIMPILLFLPHLFSFLLLPTLILQ